jgi:hypothetical protein
MLNFCGIVAAILIMAIGRIFSMSGHHYIPTNQILMISDNVEFLMVTYHYVKFYISIIIQLEVININIRNFNFPIGFYSNPHPL